MFTEDSCTAPLIFDSGYKYYFMLGVVCSGSMNCTTKFSMIVYWAQFNLIILVRYQVAVLYFTIRWQHSTVKQN